MYFVMYIYTRVDIIIEIITIISFCFLNVCTLNFSAAILAFLAGVEVVAVALTAAVPELLADAVATIVEPFDLILGARTVFVAQETEFCGHYVYIIAQLRYRYARMYFRDRPETLPVRNCSIGCPGGGGVVTAVSHLLTQSCSLTKLFSFPPHPP